MKSPWIKIAPTLVVISAASGLVWPYAAAPPPFTSGTVKVATVDPALLAAAGEAPVRDPFRTPALERLAPKEPAESTVASSKAGTAIAHPEPIAKGESKPSAATPDPKLAALSGLVLGAVSARGNHRIAVINGRVYEEGETLEGTGAEIGPVRVSSVMPHQVVLRASGGEVALTFSDGSSDRGGSRPPPTAPLASSTPARRTTAHPIRTGNRSR